MVTLIEWAKEDNIIVEPLIVRIFNKNYIGKPLENLILSETNKAIGEIMDSIKKPHTKEILLYLRRWNRIDYNECVMGIQLGALEEDSVKVIKKRIPYGKVVIIVPDVNDERTKAYYQGLLGLQQKK